MRAIAPTIIFLTVSSAIACNPDLSRNSGLLAIRVVGLPLDATDVRATISAGGESYRREAQVAVFSGELVAESVPYGDVHVIAEAATPGEVVRREQTIVLNSPQVSVVLDFSAPMGSPDGGVPEPRHSETNPISHFIRLRGEDVGGGMLAGAVDADDSGSNTYANNIAGVTTSLGSTPAAIVVHAATLGLTADLRDIDALDDLWSGEVTVALAPTEEAAGVPVASGVPSGGSVTLAPAAGQRAALAALLSSLLAGTHAVQVSGPTNLGAGGNFEATVELRLIYSGLAE